MLEFTIKNNKTTILNCIVNAYFRYDYSETKILINIISYRKITGLSDNEISDHGGDQTSR